MERIARLVNTKGHSGLPDRFVIESPYGWLSASSFDDEERAVVFETEAKARQEFARLYPDWTLERA